MNGNRVVAVVVAAVALVVAASTARAGKGAAIVLGFHCIPADQEGLPLPGAPEDLQPSAPAPGTYDVWVYLFTRAPLVGAWTLTVAFSYAPASEGSGLEIADWTGLSDTFATYPGWPSPGTGFRAAWDRTRCLDEDHRRMLAGRDGWWIQPVVRLRVRAHGPDRIALCDPEPGVRPQMTECADEMHELDGSDNWTRVIPAVFGADVSGYLPASLSAVTAVTWGALKTRHGAAQ